MTAIEQQRDNPYLGLHEQKYWAEGYCKGCEETVASYGEEAVTSEAAYRQGFDDGLEAARANIEALICDPNDPLHGELDREFVIEALGYAAQVVAAFTDIREPATQVLESWKKAIRAVDRLNTKSKSHEIREVQQALYNGYHEYNDAVGHLPDDTRVDGTFTYGAYASRGAKHIAPILQGKSYWTTNAYAAQERAQTGTALAKVLAEARAARKKKD